VEECCKDNEVSPLKPLAELRLPRVSDNLCRGALWDFTLGCAERCETAHINTQKGKKAAMLPV